MKNVFNFQVPLGRLREVAVIVRNCMETATEMKIRLPVTIKSGPNWGTMEPLKMD